MLKLCIGLFKFRFRILSLIKGDIIFVYLICSLNLRSVLFYSDNNFSLSNENILYLYYILNLKEIVNQLIFLKNILMYCYR